MTIAVTGGGTGGHVYPALAVCQALRELRPGVDLVYLGGSGGLEERLVAEEGIPFVGLPARKVRKLLAPIAEPAQSCGAHSRGLFWQQAGTRLLLRPERQPPWVYR